MEITDNIASPEPNLSTLFFANAGHFIKFFLSIKIAPSFPLVITKFLHF